MTTEPLTTDALPSPSIPVVDPPSANAPSSPVIDADLAIRTITLLQSLLEKVMGERSAGEIEKRATVRHTYTPRSNVPLIQLATPPVLPTRLRRRSLVFGCPCCGRETVVIRSQAGARIRCPHCHSAVAAPNPRRRRSAHNLERDIEAVIHPQAFAEAVRPMAPRLVRMVAKEPVLILALAALVPFTWLLMLEIPSFIERAKGGIPSTVASAKPAVRAISLADGASERAVALVERYLAAPTVQAKANWVRDPQRVAPLMVALAKRQPDLFAPVTGVEVKAAGLSHYQDPSNPVPVTPVVAALADGTSRTFFVEHTEQGDVIEWESSLGYSEPLEMAAARRGKVSPPTRAVWRVEAAPDDYFNRAFTDEEHLVCLRLSRADKPDETFWAYAPKDSEVGQSLRRIWNEAPRDFVQRLTVTVEGGATTAKTRQVRLTEVHHAGWRTPDQPATMVAKNP